MHNDWIHAAILVSYLNDLAAASANGLHAFSKCTPDNRPEWENGIVYIDTTDTPFGCGTVIADKLIDEVHHDAITSYADILKSKCGGAVHVWVDGLENDEEDPIVLVSFRDTTSNPIKFVIEDGAWHFAG